MGGFLWVLVGLCLWWVWRTSGKVEDLERQLREIRFSGTVTRDKLEEAVTAADILRRQLAATAAGVPPPRDQVLEGRFYSEIDAREAFGRMGKNRETVLIDVRTPNEFFADHAEPARSIPLQELHQRLGELPSKNTPILLICATGQRSGAAAEMLASQGFQDVASVQGGTAAWPGPHQTHQVVSLLYKPPQSV
jgi:rhodanese-related sulfurtransferase